MENEPVRRGFRQVLDQQPDIGGVKIISDWFFTPPNQFDPNGRRSAKPEVLMVLSYIVLMAAVCAAFNLT
jgi:hypothetical protein